MYGTISTVESRSLKRSSTNCSTRDGKRKRGRARSKVAEPPESVVAAADGASAMALNSASSGAGIGHAENLRARSAMTRPSAMCAGVVLSLDVGGFIFNH